MYWSGRPTLLTLEQCGVEVSGNPEVNVLSTVISGFGVVDTEREKNWHKMKVTGDKRRRIENISN